MNVWADIDRALAAYTARLAKARAVLARLGGGAVRVADTGIWSCSYRATTGRRLTVRLRGRSPESLGNQLAALRAKRGRHHG